MNDIMLFGYTLKELLPLLFKIGFVLGLVAGAYLLVKF